MKEVLSLSQTAGYAILALGCLERTPDRWALSQEVADCTGIPKPYLSKILNQLAQSGLITAKRGYRGGFTLAKVACQVTILEVVEAVEGGQWRPACMLGLTPCTDARGCPMHEFWLGHQARLEQYMQTVTIADIASFEQHHGALLKGCCKEGADCQAGSEISAPPIETKARATQRNEKDKNTNIKQNSNRRKVEP